MSSSRTNESEADHDDSSSATSSNEDDPLSNISDDLFANDQTFSSTEALHRGCSNNITSTSSSHAHNGGGRRRRDWLPSFHDQIDRGINKYTLTVLDRSVTVQLEYRTNSTGSDLWDASLVLAHYLPTLSRPGHDDTNSDYDCSFFRHKTVVELGSGVGAIGLLVRKLGAEMVCMTDLPENLNLLRRNTELNGEKIMDELSDEKDSAHADISDSMTTNKDTTTAVDNDANDFNDEEGGIQILPLDWTNETLPIQLQNRKVDVILGSDLFLPFAPHLLKPLCRTISMLLDTSSSTVTSNGSVAYIAYEERFDCTEFFQCATDESGLKVECIDDEELHPIYRDPGRIMLLRITAQR